MPVVKVAGERILWSSGLCACSTGSRGSIPWSGNSGSCKFQRGVAKRKKKKWQVWLARAGMGVGEERKPGNPVFIHSSMFAGIFLAPGPAVLAASTRSLLGDTHPHHLGGDRTQEP